MEHSVQNEQGSLKDFYLRLIGWGHYLLKKWIVVLSAGVIGGAIGFFYAVSKKPIYTAETTFVLEEGDNVGGLSSYSGIASMIGIDLNGGGSGVFQGDNILELYRSKKMIRETLLSESSFLGKNELLIHRYISFNKLRERWEKEPTIKNIRFDIPINKYSLKHDSLISEFIEDINKHSLKVTKPDKKLTIIKVEFKSRDELFAKVFTDNIVKTVNNFYVLTKTKKSSENLSILQHQADSIRAILNYNISGVANALDMNPNSNPAFQRLKVPSQKRQIDVQASGAVYQEIIKNLELAKVSFRREKPLIQVIDVPILPLEKDVTGKIKSVLLFGLLFSFLSTLFLILTKIIKTIL